MDWTTFWQMVISVVFIAAISLVFWAMIEATVKGRHERRLAEKRIEREQAGGPL